MGSCCSKTDTTITSKPVPPEPQPEKKNNNNTAAAVVASPKDVFVVKQRKSHEVERHPDQETRKSVDRKKNPNSNPNVESSKSPVTGVEGGVLTDVLTGSAATVRTSSCTKEEVDAILIQCGRLSRSSSGVKPETPTRGRRYSGSKRSFDFDTEIKNEGEEGDGGSRRQVREPRVSSRSASRRSSRERDPQQQRSGSKERGSGERRRVSRSPNRRSESPNPNSVAAGGGGGGNRPGKMVSVPATDKGNNAGGAEVVAGVKKVQVKRNAGEGVAVVGSRTAASPRARSPAKVNIRVLNENQNLQPLTLSRSNSKKAEHSPLRRNPLGELDTNVVGSEQPGIKKPNGNQTVSKTRSSRLSRELDINPETLTNPTPNPPSYASLLLEDIQNFHQKIPPTAAVADLKCATAANDRQLKKDNVAESEKVVSDDLMEQSLLKYVTVRRGGGDADSEEQESSGSNSFAGSQQLSWMSSSWEPNSGDSSDCWTSKSRSDARDVEVERSEYPRNGIGRGRVGGLHGRSAYSLPNNATFASA
ncbi:hypothetical protein HanPI659440_Chr07g0261701 [Helianthus annuus]|nr:hypothetical protein HanPI659440_Chr07g0261701 [Helianthus annuus]